MARTLTVRLLNTGQNFENSLNTEKYSLTPISIHSELGFTGKVYVQQNQKHPPNWLEFVQSGVQQALNLHTSNAKALLLVEVESRLFAITFGRGSQYFLNQEAIVPDFGWKVALNALDSSALRSIDVKTIDDNVRDTRTQTSKSSGIGAFGIDVARDLLKAVTGKPQDKKFAKRISGAESLAITHEIDFSDIGKICKKLLTEYKKDDYKREFDWVDKLQPVSDRTESQLIATLNEHLLEAIKADESSERVYLAPPDIIEWQDAHEFSFEPKYSRDDIYPDPTIEDYIEGINDLNSLTIEQTKQHRLCMNPNDDAYSSSWSIYKCFVFETRHEDALYVLTGGKWFRVALDYVETVDNFVSDITQDSLSLPDSQAGTREPDYNANAASQNSDFALVDAKIIRCGGGYGQVEPCDLFSSNRQFIHVKRRGKSSSKVLSHLFAQGRVSAEVFLEHSPFRNEFRDKLPDSHKALIADTPDAGDYEVVYAIITSVSEDDWERQLPFFSRLNLMQATKYLRRLGYKVALSRVHVR